jgi:aerobic-type carbon monoxide dehydrogenase small subunit (CoxS/CutS family)
MTEAFVQVNQVRHALTKTTRHTNLLHVLRNDLQLNGPKYGCGLGECGSCTVWVDGVAARACVIPAHGVAGRSITTLERIFINAGGRGLLCTLAPSELVRVLQPQLVDCATT